MVKRAKKCTSPNGSVPKWLTSRYEKLKCRIDTLTEKKKKRQQQHDAIGAFIEEVKRSDEPPIDFDKNLWISSIEQATVRKDGKIVFQFITGAEIEG